MLLCRRINLIFFGHHLGEVFLNYGRMIGLSVDIKWSVVGFVVWDIHLFVQIKTLKFEFLRFDIIDFYSSITEKLLKNAISFAKKFTAASDNTIKIILNARKSLLFNSNNPRMKKTGENFDVAMGSFDGA